MKIPSSSPCLSALCLFISPFIFYVISLFLCLISFCYNLEVVCGSYHSPSLCLPAYQFVHLFILLFPLSVGVCLSGTAVPLIESFVVTIKNTI